MHMHVHTIKIFVVLVLGLEIVIAGTENPEIFVNSKCVDILQNLVLIFSALPFRLSNPYVHMYIKDLSISCS